MCAARLVHGLLCELNIWNSTTRRSAGPHILSIACRRAHAKFSAKTPSRSRASIVPSPRQPRCFNSAYEYKWKPTNAHNQWWIDAFTCDPRVLWKGMKGVQFVGDPAPVAQNDILNASVGRLPVMLVYICVHPKHGTRIFYPCHGRQGRQEERIHRLPVLDARSVGRRGRAPQRLHLLQPARGAHQRAQRWLQTWRTFQSRLVAGALHHSSRDCRTLSIVAV